ncbi:MAG: thioredoxin domain-containing protein [Alphaproteobacteria bacterium]|nr:thioredoxin domain-containing protein [Alphaproteobacteria bacterium]
MFMTLIVLLLAVGIFALGWMDLSKYLGKKVPAKPLAILQISLKFISMIFLIIGINRMGMGTTYYLTTANPMILQEMAINMQQQGQRAGASEREIRRIIRRMGSDMYSRAPIMGNPNARNTIYFFTVPTCPFCVRVQADVNRLVENHGDNVRVVVKNFSIHGLRSDAATRAIVAAVQQDNDMAVELLKQLKDDMSWANAETPQGFVDNVMGVAQRIGLDVERLRRDLNSEFVQREFSNVRESAEALGVQGTPFFLINNRTFPGAIPYEQMVDALR